MLGSLERNDSDLGLRMLYRRDEYLPHIDYLWGMGKVSLSAGYLRSDTDTHQVRNGFTTAKKPSVEIVLFFVAGGHFLGEAVHHRCRGGHCPRRRPRHAPLPPPGEGASRGKRRCLFGFSRSVIKMKTTLCLLICFSFRSFGRFGKRLSEIWLWAASILGLQVYYFFF